jgi:hypothetical protein
VKQVTGKAPTQEKVDLPAGVALHISWQVRGLQVSPVADQYLIYALRRAFILTYTTVIDLTDEYAITFSRSARSFQFD